MWPVIGIVALVLFTAACSNQRMVYPGDGQLVIVDVDPALDQCSIVLSAIPNVRSTESSTVGNAVRVGIRYWDQVGVRLRTVDQLTASDQPDIATALHLRIFGDCADIGTAANAQFSTNTKLAEYHFSTGQIELYLNYWNVNYIDEKGWLWVTMKIAHEAGHAIGLDHVGDPSAVMYPNNTDQNARADLAAADVAEHARVWGTNQQGQ